MVWFYSVKLLDYWYKFIEQSPERMTDTQFLGFIVSKYIIFFINRHNKIILQSLWKVKVSRH